MQNLEIQNFASQAQLLLPDTAKRRLILPAVVGMAIGNFLAVKQGNELSPMTQFNDSHAGNVGRAVSILNEEFYLDIQAVIESAKSMFLIRHRILNAQPVEYSASPEFDFMAVAMGLSTVVPVEVYKAITETGLSAAKVYTLANLMVAKLKEAKQLSL